MSAADVLIDLYTTPSPRDVVIRKGDTVVWEARRGTDAYLVRDLEGGFSSGVLDDENPYFSRVYERPGIYGYEEMVLNPWPPYLPRGSNDRKYGIVEVLEAGSESIPILLNCPNFSVPLLTACQLDGWCAPMLIPMVASPLRTNGLQRVEFAFDGGVVAATNTWPFRVRVYRDVLGPFEITATARYDDGSSVTSLPRRLEIQTSSPFASRVGVPLHVRGSLYIMSYQTSPGGLRWWVLCPPQLPGTPVTNWFYRYRLQSLYDTTSGRLPVLAEGSGEFMYCDPEF